MSRFPFLAMFSPARLGAVGEGAPVQAGAPQTLTQAPGFYRMMLGDDEFTVLSDGTAFRPLDEIMSKPEKIRQILARSHQTLPIELSFNAFLIKTATRLILVDTGAGELFGPHSGGRPAPYF